jgi:hypothetical protein
MIVATTVFWAWSLGAAVLGVRTVVSLEQVDDDGKVHFVAVSADDPAAIRLVARSA